MSDEASDGHEVRTNKEGRPRAFASKNFGNGPYFSPFIHCNMLALALGRLFNFCLKKSDAMASL